ncbi:beta-ketoacyl-[acyl-carrier-protein] synthase family protein [Kibdelosporangium philippinense]|uniref:Beta-ketoacyl-[acyl-carrier-protein] synthase family protein n=1 Tax=Kibdelosporangium philippinense TaxID=211113 RepID=A0ABS8Z3G1_9PSEU|nr:beta-ketoacyl-[acyl-carrier-protein] synthase family protein [Kibdelosporangium philippinense]MCE7001464.1 beta-ketoacyl-[acyl-carrier-protein] synthase family protein [Kibdelosporangium philippinense]
MIAITGLGVVSPAGSTVDDFWSTLLAGRSVAAPFDVEDKADNDLPRFGCTVRGVDELNLVTAKESRRMDPFAYYGVSAGLTAYADAGSPTPDPGRTAIVVGNAVGGRRTTDKDARNYYLFGPQRVNPLLPLVSMPNAAAATLAMKLGWRGPAMTIATTCAAGVDAIGQAVLMLRANRADVVLAGGAESTVSPLTLAAFGKLNAVSGRHDAPDKASRPFDKDRDGFVMGEGAGFVVLERLEDAQARGARIHGIVAGYGCTSDAYHLSMPLPDGASAIGAMTQAITDAGLQPADIVHVNAHGTSTPLNDRAEATALQKVFGPGGPPVTSTKGVIGHLIGAAGAVEAVATVLTLRNAVVPPTANHEELEPGMEIDVVHGSPRPITPGPALSNSFGFGGHNACLVVTPP